MKVTVNYRSITRSLRTKNLRTAKKIAKELEPKLLIELLTNKHDDLPFSEIVSQFLHEDHGWSERTLWLHRHHLRNYMKHGTLPSNPNSRNMWVRSINACWNWGVRQGLTSQPRKLKTVSAPPRIRTFARNELQLIFAFNPVDFGAFCRFAYLTGGRSSEIRSKRAILGGFSSTQGVTIVSGKGRRRSLFLNTDAQKILATYSWDYSKDQVSKTFKANCQKAKISDARFHDLRRSFGSDLIRKGVPIYEVSRLLGHASVKTTERHYIHLLDSEIRTPPQSLSL